MSLFVYHSLRVALWAWRVTPDRVMGGGDQSQAQQEAGWLWQNATLFDPSVQPRLRRMCVSAMLRDPNKAKDLVPLVKVEATEGVLAAEQVFGTLMHGQQVSLRKGIDQQGYVETLIKMVAGIAQRIAQTDNVGTTADITGMMTVLNDVQEHIAIIGQDKSMGQAVKRYSDAVAQLTNEIKGYAQRVIQKEQAANSASQQDPAAMAKAQSTVMLAQTKAGITKQLADLKMQQKQLESKIKLEEFARNEQRKDAELANQMRREEVATQMQAAHDSLKAHQDAGIKQAEHIQGQIEKAQSAAVDRKVKAHAAKKPKKAD